MRNTGAKTTAAPRKSQDRDEKLVSVVRSDMGLDIRVEDNGPGAVAPMFSG